MNLFYLDKDPTTCAELHCDKHVVKMIIEYGQLLSTAHRMLDGDPYVSQTLGGRRIQRWRHPDELMEQTLYNKSHQSSNYTMGQRKCRPLSTLTCTMETIIFEYTYRYGRVHETFRKLNVVLSELPRNIPKVGFTEPPQCMPDDVKSESVIDAYHNILCSLQKRFCKNGLTDQSPTL